MKRVIALINDPQNKDLNYNLSFVYGIRYDEAETSEGSVMLFTLREEIADLHTVEYFQDLLCCIFNSSISSYYFDDSDTSYDVSIFTILLIFVHWMRECTNERHYKEKLKLFHKNRHLETIAGLPELHLLKDGSYSLTPTETYQLGGYNVERPDKTKLKGKTQEQSTVRKKNHRALYRNFKWEDLYDHCALYRDFYDGDRSNNSEGIIMLARNLCGAENGKKHFLEIINQNQDLFCANLHWNEILTAIIKNDMPFVPCDQCEYCKWCNHAEHMLATAKPMKQEIRMLKKQEYVSIEEAEQDLHSAFERAVSMDDNDIHIIKAQTGLGKTETYLQYMMHTDKPLMIAVPTHELKSEIYRRAKSCGIEDIYCTPFLNDFPFSDEIQTELDHLFQIGAGDQVLRYLTGMLIKLPQSSNDYTLIAEYLNQQKRASRFKGHIITTHAHFVYLSHECLDTHTVIIDEDILRTLLNTSSVPVSELRVLEKCSCFSKEEYSKIRAFKYKRSYQQFRPINVYTDNAKMQEIQDFDSNIIGLLRSEYAYITNTEIHFIEEKKMPDCKVILLSATVDPELYRMLYPNRSIDYYECKKARYQGKIMQYTDSSYSRHALTNNEALLDKVKRMTVGSSVITFQEIEEEFHTRYHYGCIEGLNSLAGQPLAVVGLPNMHEVVYCLYGMRLGAELKKTRMYTHRIESNGYSFSLNTYQDDILRRVQLWMLSSQLEQAVGRARLLRNPAVVTVFAGFPVEQAEYIWKSSI